MKFFLAVIAAGFFSLFGFAQDSNTTFFNPRDSKALTDSSSLVWIQSICNNANRSFRWFGCKLINFASVGTALQERDNGLAYRPINFIEGSFTRRGREEVLVTFYQLETECCVSSSVLLAKIQNRWVPQRIYEIDVGGCLKFRDGNGIDQLGCARQGKSFFFNEPLYLDYLSIQSIFFNERGNTSTKSLFFAPYRTPSCEANASSEVPVQYFELSIRNWGRQDIDQDGKPDLVIVLGERQWKSQLKAEACKEPAPPVETNRLVFVLRDLGLTPSENTRVELSTLNPRIRSYFPKE